MNLTWELTLLCPRPGLFPQRPAFCLVNVKPGAIVAAVFDREVNVAQIDVDAALQLPPW